MHAGAEVPPSHLAVQTHPVGPLPHDHQVSVGEPLQHLRPRPHEVDLPLATHEATDTDDHQRVRRDAESTTNHRPVQTGTEDGPVDLG